MSRDIKSRVHGFVWKGADGCETEWVAGHDYNARASATVKSRSGLSSDVESDQFEPDYLRWCEEELRARDSAYRDWRERGSAGRAVEE